MILLSQLTNENSLNLMCEITEPLLNILGDEDLSKILGEEIKKTTVAEIRKIGLERVVKLTSVITKSHADDFFAIFAPFFEMSVGEFRKHNTIKTALGIMEIVKDEDFLLFLQQLNPVKTTGK